MQGNEVCFCLSREKEKICFKMQCEVDQEYARAQRGTKVERVNVGEDLANRERPLYNHYGKIPDLLSSQCNGMLACWKPSGDRQSHSKVSHNLYSKADTKFIGN